MLNTFGHRMDKQEYENKINSIIESISEGIDIPEDKVSNLIEIINKEKTNLDKNNADKEAFKYYAEKQAFKNYIEMQIFNISEIDRIGIENQFEEEIITCGEKPDIEAIKSTLDKNITAVYDSLLHEEKVNNTHTNHIKELIALTIILKVYKKKFDILQNTLGYRIMEAIRGINEKFTGGKK